MELLDNRPVLFLDEPTSGLDSLSAALCVRLLHNLAHEGRIIVCTIHQPEALVYEQFDHVYVLTDGKCTYQGSAANTISYLQNSIGLRCPQYHNPADFCKNYIICMSYNGIFVIQFIHGLVLEVVNGEYGNFQMQLVQAATDERWRINSKHLNVKPNVRQVSQRLEIIESLDEDPSDYIKEYDQNVRHSNPTEWTRFIVLMARCSVHSHRDWVL